MGYVINCNGGMINNYIGDGLMALFGLENSDKAAEQAVRAGVEMLEELEKLNPYFETLYRHRLRIRIGIDCGLAVVGNLVEKSDSYGDRGCGEFGQPDRGC